MTVSTFLDVFDIAATDVVTTTFARSGYGFAPKGIIVWCFGRSDTTDAGGGGTYNGGIGAASSATRRWAEANCCVDGSDNNIVTSGVLYNAAIFVGMALAGSAIDGRLDVSSFDSDGVTFIIDDQFSVGYRIAVFAFGGTDITNVEVGISTSVSGTGNDTYNNVDDFQPDFALFGVGTNSDNGVYASARFGFGVASGTATEQGTAANFDAGSTSSGNTQYVYNQECISRTNNAGQLVTRAALVSFNASPGGVTINWIEHESTWRVGWMMVKGGEWKVGSLQTRTDGADIAVTGLASQPVGLLFFGGSKTWNTAGAESTNSIFSFGAAVSPSSRHAQAWSGDNGEATAEMATFIEHDAVYVSSDLADGVRAIMDLKSIESTGFTCVMDTVEPSAAVDVVYVALGAVAVAAKPRTGMTLLGVG